MNIKFTEGDQLFTEKWPDAILLLIILLLVIAIWEGNHLIYRFFVKRFKTKYPYSPLIYGFLISLVLVYGISIASVLIQTLFGITFTWISLKLAIGFTFRVNLFLHCVNAIIHYHNQLRNAQVDTEKHKRELANAKFESLRKQINPHFLFNSLNVLDSLVRKKEIDSSTEFISRLSTVYRYLTSIEQREVVQLKEELEFLDSYQYLLETRFKGTFKINNEIKKEDQERYIVPSALQMLVENVVKHNEISKKKPMTIILKSTESYLSISNPIHPKVTPQTSTQQGLSNIRKRYEFLGGNNIDQVNSGTTFTVKIPLIDL